MIFRRVLRPVAARPVLREENGLRTREFDRALQYDNASRMFTEEKFLVKRMFNCFDCKQLIKHFSCNAIKKSKKYGFRQSP